MGIGDGSGGAGRLCTPSIMQGVIVTSSVDWMTHTPSLPLQIYDFSRTVPLSSERRTYIASAEIFREIHAVRISKRYGPIRRPSVRRSDLVIPGCTRKFSIRPTKAGRREEEGRGLFLLPLVLAVPGP